MSFASLAWRMMRSSGVRRGMRERSMELTALYSAARVSTIGARKYSSSASRSRGWTWF
jgi:hypothetical protein